MPRPLRNDYADCIYHVMNRSASKQQIFKTDRDYYDFIEIIKKAIERSPVKIYSYCIMPNHWHFLLSPINNDGVGRFIQTLAGEHAQIIRFNTDTIGHGPVYKGRYKSVLVEEDLYFMTLVRYIERNPVRANLCNNPIDWKFSSAWLRKNGDNFKSKILTPIPIGFLENYGDIEKYVCLPDDEIELEKIRKHIR